MIDWETFRRLPVEAVAHLIGGENILCALPVNGTRRWFRLEHGAETDYVDALCREYARLCALFFEHGIDTLLMPIFGSELLTRGTAYQSLATRAIRAFATHRALRVMYAEYDARVRFYGRYRDFFAEDAALLTDLDALVTQTAGHRGRRVFYGLCANDATEDVARIAVRFHRQHGRPPNWREIVERYYGEYVAPANLFIGFDAFTVFDIPLLNVGETALYFTVAPTPYLDAVTLRRILYDYLYTRRAQPDYDELSADDVARLSRFYTLNRHSVQGVGTRANGNIWHPLPQIITPPQENH